MHLLPDQLMFGVAPLLLLDCARQIHDWDGHSFTTEEFSRALGAPVEESKPVLQAMLAAEFFKKLEGEPGRFIAMSKLSQLALANISKGISRREAEQLIARIIDKTAWVNAQGDEFGHRITCLVVFGSYLTGKPHLGDLDIGVELERLRDYLGRREDESPNEWFKREMAAHNRTLRALRLRQPKKISVHGLDEVLRLKTNYKVIFGGLPE